MIDAFKTAGSSPPAGGRLRRTNEQQLAAQELAAAAAGYRVLADAERWPTAPGKYGKLEHLGSAPGQAGQLAAFITSNRIFTKAVALPGVRPQQTGDDEFRVLLTPEAVPDVAKLLRCHRRRPAPANGFQKNLSPRPGGTSQVQEASR